MGTDNTEPSGVGRPAIGASGDRLESWKEIASYLRRDVTTVQRWEKREGMPVHRHLHDRLGSVYAYGAELDEWLARRSPRRAPEQQDGTQPVDPAAPSARELDSAPPADERRWLRAFGLIAGGVGAVALIWWLYPRTEPRWPAALEHARYQVVTDFDGIEQAAAVSRDGRLVTFVSDRDGQFDVWVTQLGTGQFHNLTRGRVRELVNPSVRTLGFSPEDALVTFWARGVGGSASNDIGIWAIPTFGGEPRPYLEGVAEFEWSRDGSRLSITRRDQAIRRSSVRRREADPTGTSFRRLLACTRTFRPGRLMAHSSTSRRARCRTRWTCIASRHQEMASSD